MNKILLTNFVVTNRKASFVLMLFVVTAVVLTLTQDLLRSALNNSAFYFSESFLFSSFWWLFAPLLFIQYVVVRQKITIRPYFQLAIILIPIVLHLFAFPLLVWLLSCLFYYHTFDLQQTFNYTVSEQFYLLVLLYSVPLLIFQFGAKKAKPAEASSDAEQERDTIQFVHSFIVAERNKKVSIAVLEILYFSANSPYISIHLEGTKYLHNETLKSVSNKLDPDQFVRVHKSTIINIKMVDTYTTRLNGDYDLTMKNGVQLRVSRNFATNFKTLFSKTHHVATK